MKAIELALRTWYSEDDELHFNSHHSLGKLLGEWGELLDDYMKSIYKPGYTFEPENELGDIWYYLRILAYQNDHELRDSVEYGNENVDRIIAICTLIASEWFLGMSLEPACYMLNSMYSAIVQIAERYDLSIDNLTTSNWQKLKPGSKRGDEWMRTRK
jgi:hypothetical protein